jgi:anti-sigma regulatory factor (Ser/Thr protein kinase)
MSQMTAERQAFPARTDAFPKVSAWVERRCGELGLGRSATLLLLLMAEELFVNAALHGHHNDGRRRIRLAIRDCGAEVELVAEDNAPEFDPFAPVAPPSPATDRIGGYGRLLLFGLSSRRAYQRRGRRNCVTVGVPKTRPQ